MATHAGVASTSTAVENRCFIHFSVVDAVDLKEFTETTWVNALSYAEIWKSFGGEKAEIATDFLELTVPDSANGREFGSNTTCTLNVIRERLRFTF